MCMLTVAGDRHHGVHHPGGMVDARQAQYRVHVRNSQPEDPLKRVNACPPVAAAGPAAENCGVRGGDCTNGLLSRRRCGVLKDQQHRVLTESTAGDLKYITLGAQRVAVVEGERAAELAAVPREPAKGKYEYVSSAQVRNIASSICRCSSLARTRCW